MDDQTELLRDELSEILRRAAELKVALDRANGTVRGVPHYSVIEEAAEEIGRELSRRVQPDSSVEIDTNHYSVPWRLIGARVTVRASAGEVIVSHAGAEIARHGERRGDFQRPCGRCK